MKDKKKVEVYKADRFFFKKIQTEQRIAYVSQTRSEEIFNTISHALGSILSGLGFFVLLYYALQTHDWIRIITSSLYGLSLFFMFFSSMMYHGASDLRKKRMFHKMDHFAIFLLIAATNTPIFLTYMKENYGWSLFAGNWVLAFIGACLEFFVSAKLPKYVSIGLYSLMGWMILLAAKPMVELLPSGLLLWLVLGGVTFTAGIFFYVRRSLFFNHVIWHVIVLIGTAFHFTGILTYIAMTEG